MDWIKQIIECKKENWVSPGSLGQKIKKIRMLRKYTQKELGVMCGFSFSSADVRIAQYEKNKKITGSFRSSQCGADAAVTDHGCSGSECEI